MTDPTLLPQSPPPTPPTDPDSSGNQTTPLAQVSQGILGTPVPVAPPVSGPRRRELGAAPLSETPAAVPETQIPVESAPVAPEVERSAEMGPELEKFVEKEKNAQRSPQETVVAANTMPTDLPKTVTKPVIVLPATEATMQAGGKKPPAFSIRWLAEWCVRQIKKFKNILVVYRENN